MELNFCGNVRLLIHNKIDLNIYQSCSRRNSMSFYQDISIFFYTNIQHFSMHDTKNIIFWLFNMKKYDVPIDTI